MAVKISPIPARALLTICATCSHVVMSLLALVRAGRFPRATAGSRRAGSWRSICFRRGRFQRGAQVAGGKGVLYPRTTAGAGFLSHKDLLIVSILSILS